MGGVPTFYDAALLAWAVAAVWIVWRRRLWDLRAHAPGTSPVPPTFFFLLGILSWVGGALAGGVAASMFATGGVGGAGETDLGMMALAGGASQLGSIAVASVALSQRRELIARGTGIGARWARGTFRRGLIAFALVTPIALFVGAGAQWLGELVARLSEMDPPGEIAHETLRLMSDPSMVSSTGWWLMLLVVVVGAPIAEELIYRGFIQNAIARAAGSQWVGILVTTGLFAAVHVGVAEWYALIPLAALSIGMGLAYARTGVIWVPIVVHAIFNGMNVLMAVVG